MTQAKPAVLKSAPHRTAVAEKPTAEQAVPTSFQSVQPCALTRQGLYVEAPDWVDAGGQLTLGEASSEQAALDVFIGIDFGTSYTKAAVGLMDAIFPVRWDGALAAKRKLHSLVSEIAALQTARHVLDDGSIYL